MKKIISQNLLITIGSKFFGFISFVYIAKVLTESDYGVFVYITMLLSLLPLLQLGSMHGTMILLPKYINDSKATNVNATYYALESMESPTVWIVGGVDKGNNYADLNKVVNKRVKAIICLGLNNLKIMDHFENVVEYIVEAKSMDEAVNAAYKISSSGDCVLLSPACASFDLFDDFEDRGRQFKTAVRKL
jgi:hypothetical protein